MTYQSKMRSYKSKDIKKKPTFRPSQTQAARNEKALSGMAIDAPSVARSIHATLASSLYNDMALQTATSARSQVACAFHQTGTVSLLNGLEFSAPATMGTHCTDVVRLLSFSIDAKIQVPAISYVGPFQCRMALVFDRKPRGTLPTLIDIFAANANGSGNATSVYAGQNGDAASRFLILREWRWSLNGYLADSAAVTQPPSDKIAVGVFGKKKFRLLTEYVGNGGNPGQGIAGIASGALLLICYGDASATASNHPLLTGYGRLTYEEVPNFKG